MSLKDFAYEQNKVFVGMQFDTTTDEIYEVIKPDGRILMFQIPAAPKGIPIAFDGHYYARDGEELAPLNIEKIERIRGQIIKDDWSAAIIHDATIEDLDEDLVKILEEKLPSNL